MVREILQKMKLNPNISKQSAQPRQSCPLEMVKPNTKRSKPKVGRPRQQLEEKEDKVNLTLIFLIKIQVIQSIEATRWTYLVVGRRMKMKILSALIPINLKIKV